MNLFILHLIWIKMQTRLCSPDLGGIRLKRGKTELQSMEKAMEQLYYLSKKCVRIRR